MNMYLCRPKAASQPSFILVVVSVHPPIHFSVCPCTHPPTSSLNPELTTANQWPAVQKLTPTLPRSAGGRLRSRQEHKELSPHPLIVLPSYLPTPVLLLRQARERASDRRIEQSSLQQAGVGIGVASSQAALGFCFYLERVQGCKLRPALSNRPMLRGS